ncbi:MAG: hypothetical protein RMJ28_01575 [Nitrososphaerota archaeon]|nr:hypothetical protein [Candidatus Calditenuaceae archaeon]MDW8072914.1 hypothetical protein [Nitrososphaerota archaeon]
MRLLAYDKQRGWVRVAALSSVDLLNLYRIVTAGDIVFQETSREVKKERASGAVDSERVSLKIGVAVEKKSLDPLMKRVRFQGRIVFADKDLDILKKYHTIQAGRGDVIEVESRERFPYFLKLGEVDYHDGVKEMLVISADDEELAVLKIESEGVKMLKTWRLDAASKRQGYQTSVEREEVFDELVQLLKDLTSDSKPKLVLLGTSIHLETLATEIRRRDIGIHGLIERKIATNIGGMDGLREALRRGALGEELKPLADAIQVENALRALLKYPEHVKIGLDEVARACSSARGGLVLATEDFVWENMENRLLDEIMSRAEKGLIRFRIILSNTEASDKINSLGGIICLEKKILAE